MSNTRAPQDVDPLQESVASVAGSWAVLLVSGLLSIGFAIALLAWPKSTVTVIAFLLGIWLLISGLFQVLGGFTPHLSGGTRALYFFSGVVSLVIGVLLVKNIVSDEAGTTAKALALLSILIGAGWLVNGIARLVAAIGSPGLPGRGWAMASGVISIIAAIVVLAWPLGSLAVLVVVSGIMLMVIGIVEVIGALVLRRQLAKA
jgi:uncharacterized membrane protein HdeD (DUF308 family)